LAATSLSSSAEQVPEALSFSYCFSATTRPAELTYTW
jgi:hypothetical protein